uniref:Uncharacterized protein n=1 Tax=Timema genevievae TaxID=629358 RepID=A0A7R9K802_TIMGE|nr:unnamed protein product [Timema genevievae]
MTRFKFTSSFSCPPGDISGGRVFGTRRPNSWAACDNDRCNNVRTFGGMLMHAEERDGSQDLVMNSNTVILSGAVLFGALLIFSAVQATESLPVSRTHSDLACNVMLSPNRTISDLACVFSNRNYGSDMEGPDSEYVLELIERLGQSIIRANDLEK